MPSQNRKKKLQIFLSHAKEDKPKVRKLCQQLREDGFDPWLDEERLFPGHDWGLEIEKAQRASDVILLCFSVKSVGKAGYIQREYKQAMDIQMEKPEGAIFVIPVRLDKCDVPFFIKKLQWVDYPTHYERLFLSLQSKISRHPPLKRSKGSKSKFQHRSRIVRTVEEEVGPLINDISYRQEVLSGFFRFIKAGESFYLLGGSGYGKTRLFDFIAQPRVSRHYLGESAENTWIIKVNPYLLATIKEPWAFYELLFRSLLMDLNNHKDTADLVTDIAKLDADIIQQRDNLLASRFFGLAVNKLCQAREKKLCFLFDEFDEAYKNFPTDLFNELRAIREENRWKLSYIFFLRHLPEKLRAPADVSAIHGLISQNVIGIGPYTKADAFALIQQLESRFEHQLTVEKDKIFLASGGHAGIIVAIVRILFDNPNAKDEFTKPSWLNWLGLQQMILAQCENILESLDEDERQTLLRVAQNEINKTSILTTRVLALKGLLITTENKLEVFSPLLRNLILSSYPKAVRHRQSQTPIRSKAKSKGRTK